MNHRRNELTIVMTYPKTVSAKDAKAYAQEAIEMWGGQREPGSELFFTTKASMKRMRTNINRRGFT